VFVSLCVVHVTHLTAVAEEGGHGHMIHALRKLSAYGKYTGKLSGWLSIFVARACKIYISFNSSG